MEIVLLKHGDTSEKVIESIIRIKMEYWNYPVNSQKEWISKNIKSDDYNLTLSINDTLQGFINLTNVNGLLDESHYCSFIGVGNVCISKAYSGKGLGLLMMHAANYYINENGKNGILFCKDKLIPFYLKAGWRNNNIKVSIGENELDEKSLDSNIMSLNKIDAQLIRLVRNF